MTRGSTHVIWTIGHSNHTCERFAELLASEQIEVVVDVRSYPYSRVAPHSSREPLMASLGDVGIKYVFLGNELGGRPSKEDHYDDAGHALYGAMADEAGFKEAIDRLLTGAADHRIALLCSEGEPQDCHRRLLVGNVLCEHGVLLRHVLPTGDVRQESVIVLDSSNGQEALFGEGEPAWRSARSVSHRRRLSTSSVG